jgi:pilus assembly protein CpaE
MPEASVFRNEALNPQVIHEPAGLCVASMCVDGHTVDALREAVIHMGGTFAGGFDSYAGYDNDLLLLQTLQRAEVPVWVIGLDRDRAAAMEACARIQRQSHGACRIVAVAGSSEPSSILEAMRAGCGEYLTRPVGTEDFAEALQRLRTRLVGKREVPSRPVGRIVALLGVRGGAGATTLAVHLGCFLVRQHGKKTLILDEHRRLGHVSLYLGRDEASYHFYELARNVARLDESLLRGFVIHHSDCLDILPSPDCFDDAANVPLDDIQRAIRFLGQNYEYVVIDCPHGIHNLSLATIDCCDEVYLVATPDVPALRDLSRSIDRFLESNVSPEKLKVIINRFSSEGALGLAQIEKALRQPIFLTVPNASSDLIRAMNTGTPVLPDHKSEFAIRMKKWAAALAGEDEPDRNEPKRKFAFWN